ncbi:MAG: right-handed parallel beta-helix repeat-containing protein [Thermoplasmata archaeon]|nr:right-handed parallel beta-helix repeat-containing protein [Thermoplasmata archaeon]
MGFVRAVQVLASFSLIASVSFSTLVTIPDGASAYIPHGPIYIYSNADFTPANGVTGGSGTPSDPFIIEGWEIISPWPAGAIRIETTDVHFIIRNVSVFLKAGPVVSFKEVENGRIENSVVSGDISEIFIGRCNNFKVVNNSVFGGHPLHGGSGIYVTQSNNTVVTGNTVVHTGPSVDVNFDTTFNSTVVGNHLTGSKTGLELFYARDMIVSDNTISVSHKGIRVDENSDNNTIINNTISVPSFGAVDIFLKNSRNNILANNIMSRGGIYIDGNSKEHWNTHIIAPSNTVIGKPVRYLKNSTGGILGSEAGQLIVANCSGLSVESLDVSGVHAAFQIGFSENLSIVRNHIHNNYWGVSVFSTNWSTITQNTVHDNNGYGMYFDNSTKNEIYNNTLHGNGKSGIDLTHSPANRVHNNTFSSNGKDALALWKSDDNTLVENVMMTNARGIHLIASKGNSVHHNSIMGNAIQAEDDLFNQKNSWDDGYPSGGNYWSDYGGFDVKRGSNQDLPGSDAIGDTPYAILVDNQDRYPLMLPTTLPPPRPPSVLEANLVGVNLEDVAVTWSLSPDDGMGLNSVVRYEVYRNTSYEWGGWSYQLIASLPNRTTDIVDNSVGEGDPNNYFYLVCAVDVNGKSSCGWDQAGKFTRMVDEGPNLLSIPLIQSDVSLERVLQTLEFDRVWTYHATSGEWESYADSKPYKGDMGTINHRIGFWVSVTEESNLTVAGIVPLNTMLQLKTGWNLVPFPSFRSAYTVSDLKAGTGATRVEGLDPSSLPYFLRVLAPAENLQAGFGYWVRVETDRVWAVDNA